MTSSQTRSRAPAAAVAALLLVCSSAPPAAGQQASLGVSAVIEDACSISVPVDLDFGPVQVGGGFVFADAQIAISCAAGVEVQIAIDGGLDPNNNGWRRAQTADGLSTVTYRLQNPVNNDLWGTGSLPISPAGAGNPLTYTGTGAEELIAVLGRMAVNAAFVPRGPVSDTVNVILVF